MAENRNIGQQKSLVVYGNPESFKKLISNHGQLCKIKQGLFCPCVAGNHGAPDQECPICHGDGFVYTYQRRFMVADEDSPRNCNVTEIYPHYIPIKEVVKVERVTSAIQGGISEMPVTGFTDETITVTNDVCAKDYDKLRVTYYFDGWTKVENDVLTVNADNGLMWPTQTVYDAGYQSSNPLKAEADIVSIEKIWNSVTGVEITNYTREGNTMKTNEPIVAGQMMANYHYADLTQIITADLKTRDDNEKWTHDIESGTIRLALYPWYNIAKGDIIVIAATAQYKTEMLTHRGTFDKLFQLEVFELNDVCIDEDGNTYYKDEDYILVGSRYISWISDNKPANEKTISIRIGYKPTLICFDENPERNSLENKKYPTIVYAKSYSKTNKDEISKLLRTDN